MSITKGKDYLLILLEKRCCRHLPEIARSQIFKELPLNIEGEGNMIFGDMEKPSSYS